MSRPPRSEPGRRPFPFRSPSGGVQSMPWSAMAVRTRGTLLVMAAWGVMLPRLVVRDLVRGTFPGSVAPLRTPAAHGRVDHGVSAPPPESPARVVNVVAHPDDDLAFLSPDLLVDLGSAEAVRTVFLTSGDGGRGRLYAAAREEGVRRAYAGVCGTPNLWDFHEHSCSGLPVLVNSLRGDRRLSLVFLRLPDGSPEGLGTQRGRGQSLQKLLTGDIPFLEQLGTSGRVTLGQLVEVLAHLMESVQPTETRVLDYAGAFGNGDHSDHLASARLARLAHARVSGEGWLTGYRGYPVSDLPPNVPAAWAARKLASIRTYARCDPAFRDGYQPAWVPRQYVSGRERRP
jgi:LmbE family N-acetylglucosaminyl deacetylase